MGRNYLNQFGPEFAVPDSIVRLLDAGHLTDTSWGNDVCPSFEVKWGEGPTPTLLTLAVDCADPDLREMGPTYHRFHLYEMDEENNTGSNCFCTNDEQEMLAALKCFMASGTIPTRR